ncbi:dinucleotide-utilizing enzyme [Microbacterium deminutum]|uniref:Dinucleotide-utilizing enzyme n=1 Tax=Microbacterium deminutum TaxID=344164 RepID=A0ABN2QDI3_9MICO
MNPRPALLRSIPFWILVAASLATIVLGWWILTTKLNQMSAALTNGSATVRDVYVGPSVALVGAVLIGVGAIGILLALAVATAASLRPKAAVEIVEPIAWTDENPVGSFAPLAPAAPVAEEAPAAAAPVADAAVFDEPTPVAEPAPVAAEPPADTETGR